MGLSSCKRCKRIFNYISGEEICDFCKRENESALKRVVEYLREYPNSTMEEVCEDCDVKPSLVWKFIQKGSIIITSEQSPIKVRCELCNTLIRTGQYCDSCKGKLAKKIERIGEKIKDDVKSQEKDNKSNGFRFINAEMIRDNDR